MATTGAWRFALSGVALVLLSVAPSLGLAEETASSPAEPADTAPAQAVTVDSRAVPPAHGAPESDPGAGSPSAPRPAPVSPSPSLSPSPSALSSSPVAVAATASATSPAAAWTNNVSLGGGVILWYYQPLQSEAKNNIDLFFANLLLDGHVGDVGLHIEPRFRESRLRPHFGGVNGGTAWLQEAYASFKLGGGVANLKVGKAYSHFALFWDNSFYGNVQVYDGLKLDPDFGASLEGAVAERDPLGVRYWAQYFVVDGQTNVALDGRETFTIPGARRRNQAILRLEPFIRLASGVTVKVGLSGEYLQADLPVVGKKDVYRGAGDVTLSAGPWRLWSEVIRQNGQTVTDFPIAGVAATATAPAVPGHASAHVNYFLVGSELTLGQLALRYNASYGGYRDLSISEWMHVPAAAYSVNGNLTFLAELVYWKRYAPAGDVLLDKSLNVTLQAHF